MDPLADVGELELHLQREVDQDQAELSLLLASAAVRTYCGWNLTRETATIQADGTGSELISLPTLFPLSVTALRPGRGHLNARLIVPGMLGMDWFGTPPTRVSYSRKGQLLRRGGWPRHCVVEADVVHGYDPAPDVLNLLRLDIAAGGLANPERLQSATVGQVSKTWSAGGGEYSTSDLHE